MKFVKPENSNFVFSAGKNPSTSDLDVTMAFRKDIPGRAFIVTEYELSDDEIQEIIRTKRMWFTLMSVTMPPILPLAHNPFEYHGYYPALVTFDDDGSGRIRIHDPRSGESFNTWLQQIEMEIQTRPILKGMTYKEIWPYETFRSIFASGATPVETVDSIVKQKEKLDALNN